jgi:hypothetical protein
VTLDALSVRMLRRSLLDPVDNSFRILQRLRENNAFRSYIHERKLGALLLLLAVVVTSLTLTVAMAALTMSANAALALLVMLAILPIVLIGSFWVQAHVLLSWLEERSMVKLLPRGRSRDRGPVNQWFVRRFRIDMGPPPQVPWIPALVFFVLPAAVLARVSALSAVGLAVLLLAAAIFHAAQDSPIAASRGRKPHAPAAKASARVARVATKTASLASAAPARPARGPKAVSDLDFTAATPRLRLSSAFRRVRSSAVSRFRRFHFRLRSAGELLLLNLPPLVEYGALGAGLFFAASARRSGSGRDLALGIALIGAALVFAGLAAIVTQRMSFRFFSPARSGYAGAPARIAGAMQVIAGGLAGAAAQALASQTWDAKLQALLTNPWPLLIPLGLLLIGAGLLLVRRPDRPFGAAGIVLYIVPKALIGAVVVGTGVAILIGWAWKIYDANAFLSFVRLFLADEMQYLEKGWHAMIEWLR